MEKYVILIDGVPQEPPVNKDNIINYNLNVEQLLIDGYKPLIEAEIPSVEEIRMYHFEYSETSTNVVEEVVFDETIQEAEERIARLEKEGKTAEINEKIAKLEQMVTDEILFGNEQNIQVYRGVIQGLKDTKEELL